MCYSSAKIRSILILATANYLVPRLQLEKKALEEVGYRIDVLNIDDISFNPRFFKRLAGYYAQVLKKTIKSKYYAVHMTHIVQLPLALVFKIFRKKVVYDAYERYSTDISEKYVNSKHKNLIRELIELFENLIIWVSVDAILVVSTVNEYLKKRYARFCSKVECLYNVPPRNLLYSSNLEDKFNNGTLVIAYVGAIIIDKGLDNFIPLLLRLKQSQLRYKIHFIGSFMDNNVRSEFIAEVNKSGLSENVMVHGQMDYQTMHKTLNQCQIGLTLYSKSPRLSAVGKGSSRKNFTYMCSGMAIITTGVGELSRVIEEEQCGIVIDDPHDLDRICKIIRMLDRDRSSALEYARNGLRAIQKKYNWDLEKQKLLGLYEMISRN